MKPAPTLIFCLIMDLLGCATYLLPGLGEWFDVIWAPVSAFIFYRSFKGNTGKIGSLINLAEELLPFTDIIPTFTIGYIYTRIRKTK
jgi:hypothetical protein